MYNLTLYNYYRSSTSYRVRIALELKKLTYEYKSIHLLNNEQNLPAYRNLNPIGGVPTLKHNDFILSQSLVIIEYLDDAFPQSLKLFPKDIILKAKVKQFCEIINGDMHAFGNLKVLQYLEKKHNYNQDEKDAWVQHWFTQGFASLEKILQVTANEYCFGTDVTVADVLLVPFIFTAQRLKMDLSPYPTVLRINTNCLARAEFLKAHPLRQIDTPTELKIN